MFSELYYWMYMTLRKIKTNDTPSFNAIILLCILQMANFGTISIIGAYLFKIDTLTDRSNAVYIGLSLYIFLFVINYFLLYAHRDQILEKYKDMLSDRKTRGQIYFWLYVILSLVIFFVTGINLVTPRY